MICLSIVSHGQREVAAALFDSLARLDPDLVSEVVYTRNIAEPEPAPVDVLPGRIRRTVIENARPLGFGANHNQAFRRCSAPLFAVLNPDLLFDDDPFPALVAALDTPRRGLVAPRIVDRAGRLQNTARALYTPVELIRQKLAPANYGLEPDWLAGMFLLFRSEAFASIGGFDERYFLYIEDVDVCTRLVLRGWTLAQCASARVAHDARRQSHRSLRYSAWHVAGMLRYWRSPGFWHYRRVLRAGDSAGGTGPR